MKKNTVFKKKNIIQKIIWRLQFNKVKINEYEGRCIKCDGGNPKVECIDYYCPCKMNEQLKRRFTFNWLYTVSALLLILLTCCADVSHIQPCLIDQPYGFWSGLWHGFIAPISFIGSLFSDNIAMYAVNNTGGWYNFGFVLGSGILSIGLRRRIND